MKSLIAKIYKPRHVRKDLEKKYAIGEELGQGNFAVVKKCTEKKTKKVYAVKIIDKSMCAGKEEVIETEVSLLRKVSHKNIVGLIEEFDTKESLYLVLEFAGGNELFDRIVDRGSYTENDASRIIRQVLEAVKYLHDLNIVHRDLKPENLLFDTPEEDSDIKVADFGLSKLVSEGAQLKSACGTPNYIAPEILLQEGYGKSIDIWAVGVILYILLCGFPPFYDESDSKLYRLILKGNVEFPDGYWDDVSESAKEVILKMLIVDPEKRMTADDALAHPWIKGETTTEKDLADTVTTNLKKYRRTKFQKAVDAVRAVQRLKGLAAPKAEQPSADADADAKVEI